MGKSIKFTAASIPAVACYRLVLYLVKRTMSLKPAVGHPGVTGPQAVTRRLSSAASRADVRGCSPTCYINLMKARPLADRHRRAGFRLKSCQLRVAQRRDDEA